MLHNLTKFRNIIHSFNYFHDNFTSSIIHFSPYISCLHTLRSPLDGKMTFKYPIGRSRKINHSSNTVGQNLFFKKKKCQPSFRKV